MTGWVAFVTDPSFGVPVLLLAGALGVWCALNLEEPPISARRRTPRPVPESDPVSRVVNAMEHGRFSVVLAEARERLDRTSAARFGVPTARLPRTTWGASQLPAGAPSQARTLRRLLRRVDRLEARTLRRESGIWLRLDFWRSHSELLRRFRSELASLLRDVTRATAGGTA
jgi:hypothetical protein